VCHRRRIRARLDLSDFRSIHRADQDGVGGWGGCIPAQSWSATIRHPWLDVRVKGERLNGQARQALISGTMISFRISLVLCIRATVATICRGESKKRTMMV